MGYQTIFHIDDDDDDLDFFTIAVNQLSSGSRCISFTSATEALERLMAGGVIPEVIFLDLNMPVMNGQEFLSRLKGIVALSRIPVIILSTTSDASTISQLTGAGATDFLTKPTCLSELINLLRPYLS